MAALYRLEDKVDVGELLQVWVSPDYRGTRLAWDLMDAIFEWASENNFHRIIAGVTMLDTEKLTLLLSQIAADASIQAIEPLQLGFSNRSIRMTLIRPGAREICPP